MSCAWQRQCYDSWAKVILQVGTFLGLFAKKKQHPGSELSFLESGIEGRSGQYGDFHSHPADSSDEGQAVRQPKRGRKSHPSVVRGSGVPA